MRGAGLGLVGLLLAGGIIFYLMWGGPGSSGYVRPAMEAKKESEKVVNTVSGKDENGEKVTDSIKYETNAKGILIKSVVAGGALEKKFGLKAGDLITDIGPIGADQFGGSDGTARDFMMSQYGRPDEWTVIRNGQKIHLPTDRNTPAASSVTAKKETPKPQEVKPVEKPVESAVKPEEKPAPSDNQNPIKSNTAKGQALDIVKQIEQGGR